MSDSPILSASHGVPPGDNRAVRHGCERQSAFLFSAGEGSPWRERFEDGLPLVLLAIATLIGVTDPERTGSQRWEIIAYALSAAVVVVLTDTATPRGWRTPWRNAAAFVALLSCSSVLTLVDPVFTVFTIAAFFRALTLRPKPAMVAGLAVTSALIHSLPAGGPVVALQTWPFLYLTIVAVQTAAIAGGFVLSERFIAQSEENRALVAELRTAMEENAGLHRQLLVQARESGVLDERQRISREIHDTLAQGLAGIITQLTAARRSGADPAESRRRTDLAIALARENLQQARRAVHALTPGELDGTGLSEALAAVTARWADRAGIDAEFSTTGTAVALHPEIETTLLRVTQEALANVAKHARATRTVVTLSYLADQVALDIRDDGVGFSAAPGTPCATVPAGAGTAERTGGYGLPGMLRRVQRIAGRFVVESEPGGGTAVCATVPAITAPAIA
ncbi:sensor histidine kinase [Saccharomonospora xinjiangensis]|uniref:sensor histidine kinase n=1 Tax=Saccharomonospora xinjiangensis TaxID=75294 RepID=UPI00350F8D42